MEGTGHSGLAMPLSTVEVAYSIVQQALVNPNLTPAQALDPFLEPICTQGSLAIPDSLDLVFPSHEAILEAFIGPNRPWDDLHHRSYFVPKLRRIEAGEFMLTITRDRSCPVNPMATQVVYTEGNMVRIAKMIPIDISKTLGVMENVFVGPDCSHKEIQIYTNLFKEFGDIFSWSYEEMLGIDPRIVKHGITTNPNAKLV